MSEPRVIWSGTYAGIGADVRVVNGKPVPFLAGRMACSWGDAEGVFGAAVLGLAIERDRKDAELRGLYEKRQDVLDGMTRAVEAEGRANKAFYDMQAERDELRERLAKLEAAARRAYEYYSCEDGCGCDECEASRDLWRLLTKGAGDVET